MDGRIVGQGGKDDIGIGYEARERGCDRYASSADLLCRLRMAVPGLHLPPRRMQAAGEPTTHQAKANESDSGRLFAQCDC